MTISLIDFQKNSGTAKGFIASHSVGNYSWIFTRINEGEKGYVKKR